MAAPKKYPDELRVRAVRLYRSTTQRPTFRQLGVHHEALRNWVRQAEADESERDDRPSSTETEELRRLRKENAELKRANDILKAASDFFRPGDRPDKEAIIAFVEVRRDDFGVDSILRHLEVAPSTFYGWLAQDRDPSMRRRDHTALLAEAHDPLRADYGAPRVPVTLRRRGRHISRKRVERLVRAAGLQGAYLRRRWHTSPTRQDPRASPAPDLVERDFTTPAPGRIWIADATHIPCARGAFWLAAVRDVFSNRIVGWKTSDRCDIDLVLGALEYAVWSRDVRDGQLCRHSHRGSSYTSFRFGARLSDHWILASMGSVGDSYDNALMENFFSILKTELVYRTSWRTREQAENALFTYIDGWCNRERIQARLGWLSPEEYGHTWHSSRAQPEPVPAS